MTTTAAPGRELLACPFCGADAEAKMYGRDMLFKVECNGCGAEMRGFDQCQQDAIDAWNTRLAAKPADEGAREAVEHIEMAQSRLRAAMMGDEPCKPCVDLAASYLQEATKALASTTGEPKR